jgi:hypothetical protein
MLNEIDNCVISIKLLPGTLSDQEKRLDVCIPIIKTYQFLAFPLSIICFHDNVEGWFYTNFINTYSKFCDENNSVDFRLDYNVNFYDDIPYYLGKETFSIQTFNKLCKNTVEQFIQVINDNKYICVFLDEYYITFSYAYQESHNIHDLMIIGYNLHKQSFTCLAYGINGQYEIRELLFNDFISAWESEHQNQNLPIILFRWIEHEDPYIFDLDTLIDSIDSYINGDNISKNKKCLKNNKYDQGYVYGINMYTTLNEYINYVILNPEFLHLREIPFYLVYEHKNCMLKRLLFLNKNGISEFELDILNRYKDIIIYTKKLLNLVLKYNIIMKKNTELLNKMKKIILELHDEEEDILTQVITKLKNYKHFT